MKDPVRRFMSLDAVLKELEPLFVGDGHFRVGVPLKMFGGMGSWEVLASWLLCVAINWKDDRRLVFTTDTLGGDGIIVDDETGQTWPTARVMVAWRARANLQGVIEQLILNAIKDKCAKVGAACKAGKTLIILLHAESGVWHPDGCGTQFT